jgi:hypothetical protein
VPDRLARLGAAYRDRAALRAVLAGGQLALRAVRPPARLEPLDADAVNRAELAVLVAALLVIAVAAWWRPR